MIQEQGIVVACEGDYAEVEAQRRSACNHCSGNSSCGTSLLARTYGARASRLRVLNRVGARPGDRVVVGLPEQVMLRSAFLLYAVPLLAFIGSAVAGRVVGEALALPAVEFISVVMGLLGLLGGLAWVRYRTVAEGMKSGDQAVILRRETNSLTIAPPTFP